MENGDINFPDFILQSKLVNYQSIITSFAVLLEWKHPRKTEINWLLLTMRKCIMHTYRLNLNVREIIYRRKFSLRLYHMYILSKILFIFSL